MENLLNPRRDWEFYCEGLFSFQVEGILFRVPCYLFEETFEEVIPVKGGQTVVIQGHHDPPKWRAPAPEYCNVSKLSDRHQILLEGISGPDFRAFLRVLSSSSRRLWPAMNQDKDEWVSVLKLSTMWGFSDERLVAIQALETMMKDPVEKLGLSKTYKVPSWREPALDELSKRQEPLTLREGEVIGLEDVIRVAVMREAHARGISDTGTFLRGVPVSW